MGEGGTSVGLTGRPDVAGQHRQAGKEMQCILQMDDPRSTACCVVQLFAFRHNFECLLLN